MTALDEPRDRLLPLTGTVNLRDVGGYPVTGGGTTAWGRLLRSDALHRLTDADRRALDAYGLRLVVDLRDAGELAAEPSALDGLDVRIEHVPVFDAAAPRELVRRAPRLAEVYDLMLDQHGDRLAAAVGALAGLDEGAALVHCKAGKDRTGLVVALVLSAVGVPAEVVAQDYAASADNLAGPWADEMLAAVGELGASSADVTELMTASPAGLMELLLERVEREHGSAAGYLQAHGLPPGVDRPPPRTARREHHREGDLT